MTAKPKADAEAPAPPEVVEHGNLIAALAAAQGEFPPIAKTKTARVDTKGGGSYEYSYADIADVLAAVRPVLSRHGLALIQRTAVDGDGRTRLVTELKHGNTGDVEVSEVDLGQSSTNPQQFGGALTYLRRYELVTLLGIAAEEDRDAQDVIPPARTNGDAIPAFAQAAHPRRRRELEEALEPLLGKRPSDQVIEQVVANLGKLPDGFVAFGKLLAAKFAGALEATGQAEPYRRELSAVLAEHERQRARRELEPDVAEDAATGGPAADHSEGEAAGDAELEARAREEHEAAEAPDAPPDDRPQREPAGTVDEPDLDENASGPTIVKAYREAGCICPDPLAVHIDHHRPDGVPPADLSDKVDDACPIKRHGIPF